MDNEELYKKLCDVIVSPESPTDPFLAISAVQGILATLILSYVENTGKDITSVVLEALLRQINEGLDRLEKSAS